MNACSCEQWLPSYDGALMCYHCKLPLSKERAEIAASFWQDYRPSEFYEGGMYNVSKLELCFKKWRAIIEGKGEVWTAPGERRSEATVTKPDGEMLRFAKTWKDARDWKDSKETPNQ